MSLRVLFFASLADVVGSREVELDASEYPDVGSIFSRFEKDFPKMAEYRRAVMYAVNSEYASPETAVKDGDEIAFLPPVSGG
jgi:molybdopterin converting factor subunit 1